MSANHGPGYSKHPDHRLDTSRAGARVRITFNGKVIADTRDAIKLEESGYAPVFYVPRQDVKMEYLTRTGHRTHCPFKGDASYYPLSSVQPTQQIAACPYEQPYTSPTTIH